MISKLLAIALTIVWLMWLVTAISVAGGFGIAAGTTVLTVWLSIRYHE